MSCGDNEMATLYVGDLHPEVSELVLMQMFSFVGPVKSVQLCKSRTPGTFYNYAFVHFQHEADAERALELFNYELLLGQPMRIMRSNENPSIRNNNTGNIFLKGLEKSIDSCALFSTFSNFGHVLSTKVVCDEYGSRGYGFVHFENVEDAEMAVKKLNGKLLNNHKVFITHLKTNEEVQAANMMTILEDDSSQAHVSQVEREDEGHPNFQNTVEQVQNPTDSTDIDAVPALVLPADPTAVSPIAATVYPALPEATRAIHELNPAPALYVGNLHLDVTESLLLEKFKSVGPVLAVRLCRTTRPNTTKNYAFIKFQHEKDAERALDLLKDNILLGQAMHIMWSNRNPSLRNRGNVFIKGLEKSIDSLALYDIFSIFGYVLSCKVVFDEHGFKGYVQFENVEDAEMAIKELNGKLFKDLKMLSTHLKSHPESQSTNKMTAKGDSKKVNVSGAQKAKERHPNNQNRVGQAQNPKTTATDKVSPTCSSTPGLNNLMPAAVNPIPGLNNLMPAAVNPIPGLNNLMPAAVNPIPGLNNLMPAAVNPIPGLNNLMPAAVNPIPGLNNLMPAAVNPIPGLNNLMPAAVSRIPGLNNLMPAAVNPIPGLINLVRVSVDSIPGLNNLMPAAVPEAPKPVPALYVGNLHPAVTELLLLQKFGTVGKVISVRLYKARTPGLFNNYAFVYFQNETDAKRALRMLNFDTLMGQPIRIMWSKRNSNMGNIFIKGLEKSIDNFALYDIFRNFGNILSCKVVCDENGSRGYGYVHFENGEDAEMAIRKLNGKLFNNLKVSITHFKSLQERQAEKNSKKNQSLQPPKNINRRR